MNTKRENTLVSGVKLLKNVPFFCFYELSRKQNILSLWGQVNNLLTKLYVVSSSKPINTTTSTNVRLRRKCENVLNKFVFVQNVFQNSLFFVCFYTFFRCGSQSEWVSEWESYSCQHEIIQNITQGNPTRLQGNTKHTAVERTCVFLEEELRFIKNKQGNIKLWDEEQSPQLYQGFTSKFCVHNKQSYSKPIPTTNCYSHFHFPRSESTMDLFSRGECFRKIQVLSDDNSHTIVGSCYSLDPPSASYLLFESSIRRVGKWGESLIKRLQLYSTQYLHNKQVTFKKTQLYIVSRSNKKRSTIILVRLSVEKKRFILLCRQCNSFTIHTTSIMEFSLANIKLLSSLFYSSTKSLLHQWPYHYHCYYQKKVEKHNQNHKHYLLNFMKISQSCYCIPKM